MSGLPIGQLNRLPAERLQEDLRDCCAATRWVNEVAGGRPYADRAALERLCEAAFDNLEETDWLEAFAAHPEIGELRTLEERFASTAALAAHEQSGTAGARHRTLELLAEKNRDYKRRFGYIFIVFATGKSAEQMLQLLEERLVNEPSDELAVAAAEQRKITRLRLRGMLETRT